VLSNDQFFIKNLICLWKSALLLPSSISSFRQWLKTIRVLDDGRLEMDINLIENKISPLALCRKKYQFAGRHDAAQNVWL